MVHSGHNLDRRRSGVNIKISAEEQCGGWYKDQNGALHHQVDLLSTQVFTLQPAVIDSGPYAGAKALIILPTKTFPFQKLPAELREMVYEIVLSNDTKTSKKCSILRTSREIFCEARPFLFRREFNFSSMQQSNSFLRQIRPNLQFITKITVLKSGTNALRECYQQLIGAARLKNFSVCLPANFKGTIAEHIAKHWEALRIYLLANGSDEEESKRRLQKISFMVGRSQTSVTTNKGVVLRFITPDTNAQCRKKIETYIERHFENERFKDALEKLRACINRTFRRDQDTDYVVMGVKAGDKKLQQIEARGLDTIDEEGFMRMLETGVPEKKRARMAERSAAGGEPAGKRLKSS
ncbi:hypothetical protein EJ03DRAFT_348633 [Teratosphaeria nubilosa]|uniref:Uncharacterized protein n=1 Tax=Teratosphaeria nubilosa TaxID=161662 RepID=A0A6G1LH94_9PEZI|nr:hypothetical protein EJ03DRAFT_348633 [Teratosphaeria nubilosa]